MKRPPHLLSPFISPSVHLPPSIALPDASLYGLTGGTADGIQAVCEFVLFVVQEPPGVRQAPDLHPCVALWLQLLGNVVHVQQGACTARANDSESGVRGCSWVIISDKTHTFVHTAGDTHILYAQYWPASCKKKNLGVVQTFCQQLVHHLPNDHRPHERIVTWQQKYYLYISIESPVIIKE